VTGARHRRLRLTPYHATEPWLSISQAGPREQRARYRYPHPRPGPRKDNVTKPHLHTTIPTREITPTRDARARLGQARGVSAGSPLVPADQAAKLLGVPPAGYSNKHANKKSPTQTRPLRPLRPRRPHQLARRNETQPRRSV